MHTFKYGIIMGFTRTACDLNNGKSTLEDTAETHDTADTSSPTGPDSILTQTDDESQYSRTLSGPMELWKHNRRDQHHW